MRGAFAIQPQVEGRARQCNAEVPLPHMIDQGPRHQGMIGPGEPAGEGQAATRALRRVGGPNRGVGGAGRFDRRQAALGHPLRLGHPLLGFLQCHGGVGPPVTGHLAGFGQRPFGFRKFFTAEKSGGLPFGPAGGLRQGLPFGGGEPGVAGHLGDLASANAALLGGREVAFDLGGPQPGRKPFHPNRQALPRQAGEGRVDRRERLDQHLALGEGLDQQFGNLGRGTVLPQGEASGPAGDGQAVGQSQLTIDPDIQQCAADREIDGDCLFEFEGMLGDTWRGVAFDPGDAMKRLHGGAGVVGRGVDRLPVRRAGGDIKPQADRMHIARGEGLVANAGAKVGGVFAARLHGEEGTDLGLHQLPVAVLPVAREWLPEPGKGLAKVVVEERGTGRGERREGRPLRECRDLGGEAVVLGTFVDDGRLGRGDPSAGHGQQAVTELGPQFGVERSEGELDGSDVGGGQAQDFGNARRERSLGDWVFLVPPDQQVRGGGGFRVVDHIIAMGQRRSRGGLGGLVSRQFVHPPSLRIGAHSVRFEEGPKAVVLFLRDWVVFVVVATAALERQTQERLPRVLDRVLQPDVAVEDVIVPPQEAPRSLHRQVARGDFVGSEHLEQHLIVRFVLVEAVENPVAPPPDVPTAVAKFVPSPASVPVAVPPDIHEVAAPPLGVAGAVEQAVDHAVPGIGGSVGEKLGELAGRGGEAGEIERHPPQQRGAIGFGDRFEPQSLPVGCEEEVHRVFGPGGEPTGRCGNPPHWLERPMLSGIGLGFLGRGDGPLVDPLGQQFDLSGGEWFAFTLGRHAGDVVGPAHGIDQQTVGGSAGLDGWPACPSCAEELRGIETQPILLAESTMAGDTPHQ